MKETIIDVLMYLFENHMEGNSNIPLNEELVVNELKQAGFDINEISRAFDWLDNLTKLSKLQPASKNAFRALNLEEKQKLEPDAWGFILFLEQIGILTAASREMLMDRVVSLSFEKIDLPLVKWVALMVLFNQRDQKEALKTLEQLVLSSHSGLVH